MACERADRNPPFVGALFGRAQEAAQFLGWVAGASLGPPGSRWRAGRKCALSVHGMRACRGCPPQPFVGALPGARRRQRDFSRGRRVRPRDRQEVAGVLGEKVRALCAWHAGVPTATRLSQAPFSGACERQRGFLGGWRVCPGDRQGAAGVLGGAPVAIVTSLPGLRNKALHLSPDVLAGK